MSVEVVAIPGTPATGWAAGSFDRKVEAIRCCARIQARTPAGQRAPGEATKADETVTFDEICELILEFLWIGFYTFQFLEGGHAPCQTPSGNAGISSGQ